ncbi:MAG: hypothetical protein ACR2PC_05965 [Tsuneonella suprasediminis]|nr:hypothetical protein [Altericroceibacterium spongiae]
MTNLFPGEGDRSLRPFASQNPHNRQITAPLPVAVHLMEMFQ